MQANTPLRDMVRSTIAGPLIRDLIVIPYRRQQWRRDVRRRTATDPARFECNLCGYRGLFATLHGAGGPDRAYAVCPNCGSCERHRLQKEVLDRVLPDFEPSRKSILHFAPERFLKRRLKSAFGVYRTADLFRADVDVKADITNLPMPDESYDVVYASHVLEHVPDDRKAVTEIYRILNPGGIAILPVPINVAGRTVEYGAARPEEHGHVRAPGLADYFDRYREVFDGVTVFSSDDFEGDGCDHQTYVRLRTADGESRIPDFVPVCFKREVGGESSASVAAMTRVGTHLSL
jgi:SAM-dependent methyltransferase